MTVRVFNGQANTNEPLVWRTRDGVSRLEPESGWVNPQTICAYYMTLTPKQREALTQQLACAEIEKVQQELADDHAYELSRLANKPLT
jgi:hypothetical protein